LFKNSHLFTNAYNFFCLGLFSRLQGSLQDRFLGGTIFAKRGDEELVNDDKKESLNSVLVSLTSLLAHKDFKFASSFETANYVSKNQFWSLPTNMGFLYLASSHAGQTA
jgi:hypothetical protein